MKYLLYIVAFILMIWALIEQTTDQPNIYVQIAAVIVFFYLMMKLMDKAPSKFDEQINDTSDESGN